MFLFAPNYFTLFAGPYITLILMRSESELQILEFLDPKNIRSYAVRYRGLLMQSDIEKSDGTNSDLRIRRPNI